MKVSHKNEQLKKLVSELKKLSIEKNVQIWKTIAEELERSAKNARAVNIYKIAKYTKENETVIVPGKVLGTGDLTHKINVAAFKFSEEAHKKVSEKGKALTIEEIMKHNPEGKGLRIMG